MKLTTQLLQQVIKEELERIQREVNIPPSMKDPKAQGAGSGSPAGKAPTAAKGTSAGIQRSEFDKEARGRLAGKERKQLDSKEMEMINNLTTALHRAAGKQGVALAQNPQLKRWLQHAHEELAKITDGA